MRIVLRVGIAVVVIWGAAGRMPCPIALVVAGGSLGFVPGRLRTASLPALMRQMVLPPILVVAATKISWAEAAARSRAPASSRHRPSPPFSGFNGARSAC